MMAGVQAVAMVLRLAAAEPVDDLELVPPEQSAEAPADAGRTAYQASSISFLIAAAYASAAAAVLSAVSGVGAVGAGVFCAWSLDCSAGLGGGARMTPVQFATTAGLASAMTAGCLLGLGGLLIAIPVPAFEWVAFVAALALRTQGLAPALLTGLTSAPTALVAIVVLLAGLFLMPVAAYAAWVALAITLAAGGGVPPGAIFMPQVIAVAMVIPFGAVMALAVATVIGLGGVLALRPLVLWLIFQADG